MKPEGLLQCSQELVSLRPWVTFCNKLIFYSEEIAPHPIFNLEDLLVCISQDNLTNNLKTIRMDYKCGINVFIRAILLIMHYLFTGTNSLGMWDDTFEKSK